MGPTDQANDNEITQEDWDAVTAEDDSAVSLSGASETGNTGDDGTRAEDETPATGGSQDQPGATGEAAPAPAPAEAPADPYAGLPEPVRAALARIPTLEHELRSTVGRVGALQRELAQARTPAPAAEAPAAGKLAALREELPEVADAIQEALGHAGRGVDAEALRNELAAQLQEELLEANRPTWAQDLTSPAFNLWLDQQGPEYAQAIRSSTKAAQVLSALSKFDKHMAATQEAAQRTASRGRRLANAVTPQSGARVTPNRSEFDMTPDELWDDVTR